MREKSVWCKSGMVVVMVFLTAVLFACGGQQAQTEEQAAAPVEFDPPLTKGFKNIMVDEIQITSELEEEYREALTQCQSAAIWALQDKKSYQDVDRMRADRGRAADTLILKITVNDMRLVSGGARFWAGAMAGSSYMNMTVDFIDAMNQTVLRQKEISSANNPFGAAWTGGSTDNTLPADMGKIIAEYVHTVMPKQ